MDQVPDAVAEADAALFEMRSDAPFRRGRVWPESGAVAPLRAGIEHVEHVLGVVRPVGGQVQEAARRTRVASKPTKPGWIRRRLWWRFFGHGSGK